MQIKRKTFNSIILWTFIVILLSTGLSILNLVFFGFVLLLAVLVQGLTLVLFGLDEDDIKDEK